MLKKLLKKSKGITIVEVILATVLVTILVTGIAGAMSYGITSASRSNQGSYAAYLAAEGIEALRNMRDNNYSNLTDGTYGFALSGNTWTLSGTSDTTSIYTRQVVISTQDTDTKRAVVSVTWNGQTYTQIIDLTQWQAAPPVTGTLGMLVYGDGGTTTDAIKYRLLKADGTWNTVASTADIDTGTTNKAVVSLRLFSSKTRNEKVLITKSCDGVNNYYYAQVWNGNTTTWGNVVLLGSYGNLLCTAVNVAMQDYSGAYLDRSGDFVAMINDNTTIPKFKVWNGGYWSAAINGPTFANPAQWLILRNAPGTNEMALLHYSSAQSTRSSYFSGSAYLTANWAAVKTVQNNGSTDQSRTIDLDFSPTTPTKTNFTYAKSNNDTTAAARICTSTATDCTLGGVINAGAYAAKIRNANVNARPVSAANEYMQCNKYGAAAPFSIACRRSNVTPTFTTPTNPIITTITDPTGLQFSYDFKYGASTGNNGIIVYTDETTVPKLKKYNPSTNTFDAAATNLSVTTGVTKNIRIVPQPTTDDQMVMIGDANGDFYTQVWNGTTNLMYTTPSGKAYTAQGTNGYNYQDNFFDFDWDYTLPTVAHIQNTYNVGTSTVASQATTLPQPVTAGDTIVVSVDAWTGGTCTLVGGNVTDNKGNTYTYINESNGGGNCTSVWYGRAVTGGSNFTITVTPPAARWMTTSAHEYKGIIAASPLNGNNANSATATAATGGNVTTTNANDMIFGAFGHGAGTIVQANVTSPFSYRAYYPDGTNEPMYTMDRFVSATGTYAAAQTFASSSVYGGVTVAFKTQ